MSQAKYLREDVCARDRDEKRERGERGRERRKEREERKVTLGQLVIQSA